MINPSFEAVDRVGKFLGLQTASASRLKSAFVGPAGRRLEALFSGGLARSPFSGEGAVQRWVAERIGATDGEESVVE